MKFRMTMLSMLVLVLSLQGCETFKGAAQGFKKDVQQMRDGNSGLHKIDAWMQEHLW